MQPNITIFHCINTFADGNFLPVGDNVNCELNMVKLPCSGMVKDVFLLRAFESGADAVIVMACPEGECRHVEGNIRAQKRVEWTKKILDEIGLDSRRLTLVNISPGDVNSAIDAIQQTISSLADFIPNPPATVRETAVA